MKLAGLTMATLALAAAITTAATPALARDNIQIAGSSTVLPYATIVAEFFGENFAYPTPVVEGGGSGAGRKMLCEGVGAETIDIANSSSRITQSDLDTCARNGVAEVMEVRIGYDGIVFASDIDGAAFAFTPADLYDALAAQVLVGGTLVANPNTTWAQVNPALPAQSILVFIPGTKHGSREVFDVEVLEAGCTATGAEAAFAAAGIEGGCTALRTDGASVDIDGNYTETLARIAANRQAVGVFGLSFFENNTDSLQVATMSGITPSARTIASGAYPVSRPLYFYVKMAHLGVIPGLQAYVDFFVSDQIAGPDGPLADYGLVSDPELAATQALVADGGTAMDPLP